MLPAGGAGALSFIRSSWKAPVGIASFISTPETHGLRRSRWLPTITSVVLALMVLASTVCSASLMPREAGAQSAAGTMGVAPPEVSAKAVYAIDLDSGAVLYSKHADDKRPIASITKVVTALVTVQHVGLDEQVTIAEDDLIPPDSSFTKVGLRAGDVLTVADLLEGLLLPSGGDAANALARYVGGKLANTTDVNTSMTAFIDEMNAYATSLGLTESYFTSVAGDDDMGAFSSAHDLAIIGAQLMKNADLAWMVSQPSMQIASQNGEAYPLKNTNEMIQADNPVYDPNVVGIKTGSTEGAGASVLLARKANGGQSTVILVILGSTLEYDGDYAIITDERWADATAIFQDMDARFTWTQLDETGSAFPGLSEQLSVWGLELRDPPVVPLDKGATFQLVVGSDGGENAGEVIVYSGESELASIPVYAAGSGSAGWYASPRQAG